MLLSYTTFLIMRIIIKAYYRINHSLIILIVLEALSLLAFFALILLNSNGYLSPVIFFVYIVLAVCEASMGLCLLIRLARSSGNDLLPISIFKLIKLKTFKVFNGLKILV